MKLDNNIHRAHTPCRTIVSAFLGCTFHFSLPFPSMETVKQLQGAHGRYGCLTSCVFSLYPMSLPIKPFKRKSRLFFKGSLALLSLLCMFSFDVWFVVFFCKRLLSIATFLAFMRRFLAKPLNTTQQWDNKRR